MTATWVEPIGAPIPRVEATDKVSGRAIYTGDVRVAGIVHAVIVPSAITAGRLRGIDTAEAERAPGVLAVITHLNRPPWRGRPRVPYYAESRLPLADDQVHHGGQPIAVVVAENREQAEHAAALVRCDYEHRPPVPTLDAALPSAYPPSGPYAATFPPRVARGDAEAGFASAPARIDASYRTAMLSHTPMEPSVTLAEWDGDRLTLHDSSQAVHTHRPAVATAFGMPAERIRMISSLVGGGFGNKSFAWGHTLLAALAARMVSRPVQLALTREQVFANTGHMSATRQRIRLGADREGRLTTLIHESVNPTSMTDDRHETVTRSTHAFYPVPHLLATERVAKVNLGLSGSMRTPGDTAGQFAIECALDELASQLGIDPIELRRRNQARAHAHSGKPWGGNRLLECLEIGAREFGWARRDPRPGIWQQGNDLVGWGMATGIRAEHSAPATAEVELTTDGHAVIRTATQEIGGGSLTTMVQVAASGLGLPPERVSILAGDTDLPAAAPTFGSLTSGSTGSAVSMAATAVRKAAVRLAVADPRSPLHGLPEDAITATNGRLHPAAAPTRGESYQDLLRRHGIGALRDTGRYLPPAQGADTHALATFAAHFAEVRIDRDLPRVRISRLLGVFDCGRVLNHRTAANQAQGGMIFAMGGALTERLTTDPTSGRLLTPSLAEYHIPVHADVGDIRALFVDKPEPQAHPIGAKGLGEICSVGTAAAIANAVHHATGKRIRELPITPDKLL